MTVERPDLVPTGATAFAVCGVSAVVAGGLVAAITGPTGWERGSWVAAFLVLVAGVSQVGLGFGRVLLPAGHGDVPTSNRLAAEVAAWNGGSLLVILGGALSQPALAGAGGVLLLIGLASFGAAAVTPAARRAGGWRTAYVALVVLLAISVPCGVVISLIRDRSPTG